LGGQAVAVVQFGVAVAADAEEAEVEQADGGGEDAPPGEAAVAEVCPDGFADGGEAFGDVEDVFVLGLFLFGAELGVVQVLAASGGVGADGLEVAVGAGADPDVLPGRRDDEGLDAGEFRRVAQGLPRGAEVAETRPWRLRR
jgi:hypothetical protein